MKTNMLIILKALAEKKAILKAERNNKANKTVQNKGKVCRKMKCLIGYQL